MSSFIITLYVPSPDWVAPGSLCWYLIGNIGIGGDSREWRLGRFQQYVYEHNYETTYASIVDADGNIEQCTLDKVSFNSVKPTL